MGGGMGGGIVSKATHPHDGGVPKWPFCQSGRNAKPAQISYRFSRIGAKVRSKNR